MEGRLAESLKLQELAAEQVRLAEQQQAEALQQAAATTTENAEIRAYNRRAAEEYNAAGEETIKAKAEAAAFRDQAEKD